MFLPSGMDNGVRKFRMASHQWRFQIFVKTVFNRFKLNTIIIKTFFRVSGNASVTDFIEPELVIPPTR